MFRCIFGVAVVVMLVVGPASWALAQSGRLVRIIWDVGAAEYFARTDSVTDGNQPFRWRSGRARGLRTLHDSLRHSVGLTIHLGRSAYIAAIVWCFS